MILCLKEKDLQRPCWFPGLVDEWSLSCGVGCQWWVALRAVCSIIMPSAGRERPFSCIKPLGEISDSLEVMQIGLKWCKVGKVFCSSGEICSSALVQGAVKGPLVTWSFWNREKISCGLRNCPVRSKPGFLGWCFLSVVNEHGLFLWTATAVCAFFRGWIIAAISKDDRAVNIKRGRLWSSLFLGITVHVCCDH